MKPTLLFALLLTLLLPACAPFSQEKFPAKDAEIPVEIDASARESAKGKRFRLSLSGTASPSLQDDENLRKIERALVLAGYVKAGKEADLELEARFSRDAPAWNLPFSKFRHVLTLQALRGKELLWEVKASSASREEDNRALMPYLLLGALSYMGESSGGRKEISVRGDDPRLPALFDGGGKRGLLQR